jgi:hypothetical protein
MKESVNGDGGVALWGALAAFFGNLVAYKALTLLTAGNVRLGVSALLTSFCVAGVVYARSKYEQAKQRKDT